MSKIIQLPDDVVSQIAAGEVIERPSFAVKELIENAIDAKATVIEIHIEEGGLKKIQVIDNGIGMNKDDILLCFLPHTTSKLKKAEELLGIKTFGFRGEALSSIAAVSTLHIQSRTKSNPGGVVIELKNGKIENTKSVGMPPGTIISVYNLFHSIPARKKFLKSIKTEFRHITDIVMNFVLNFPDVHFILTHNKKTILNFPAKNTEDRWVTLFGDNSIKHFIPVNYEEAYISIKGSVGKPQVASKNNNRQYVYVNNRFVTDKIISLAVKEAFGTLIPSSTTPVFRLNIFLPYEMVDVNVHPRKEQVSFVNAQTVFDAVKSAVTQVLSENNITFNLSAFKKESAKFGETTTFAAQLLKEEVLDRKVFLNSSTVIQLHNTYILSVTKEGYVLFDQHAVHERILYEKFINAFEKQKNKKEYLELKKPFVLHLGVIESQVIDEYLSVFSQMGFEIESFSGSSYIVRKVPVVFKGRNIEKIVSEMITDLTGGLAVLSIDSKTKRLLAFLSCRAAVMAGERLSESFMKKLVSELDKTKNNSTCPHGRPTFIQISIRDIHKLFKRL